MGYLENNFIGLFVKHNDESLNYIINHEDFVDI